VAEDNSGTDFYGSFTMEAWIRTSGSPDLQQIIEKYDCGGTQQGCPHSLFSLRVEADTNGEQGLLEILIRGPTGLPQELTGTTNIADGVFHHVAAVRDVEAGLLLLYVDGTEEARATLTVSEPFENGDGLPDLVIGAGRQGGPEEPVARFFVGEIDELQISNYALSASAIQAIYDAGSAGKCKLGAGSIQAEPVKDLPGIPVDVWTKEPGIRLDVESPEWSVGLGAVTRVAQGDYLLPDGTRETGMNFLRCYGSTISSAPPIDCAPSYLGCRSMHSAVSFDEGWTWIKEPGCRLWGPYGKATVIGFEGGLRMYFTDVINWDIRSATSTDGLVWAIDPGVRISKGEDPDYDSVGAIESSVIELADGTLRMYYIGRSDLDRILSATSSDGLNWIKEDGVRIDVVERAPGTGALDGSTSGPSVYRLPDGTFRMYYIGGTTSASVLRYLAVLSAVSSDGLAWTTEPDERINLGLPGSLDEHRVYSPTIIPLSDGRFRMLYGGRDDNDLNRTLSAIAEGITLHGSVRGLVVADCPEAGTGLFGVRVDAFEDGLGDLVGTDTTDETGFYEIPDLTAGDYTLTVVTPLGYAAASDEIAATIVGGQVSEVDFNLECLDVTAEPRTIGFWKHQVGVATGGHGNAQIDGETLCSFLDDIALHFNGNAENPVIVYDPPASGYCDDKLQEAKTLLNLRGSVDMVDRAKQQLMAVLFNVVSARLNTVDVISDDGATLSQAITFSDNQIDDAQAGDHELAKTIADRINNGKTVPAGLIPLDTPNIAYGSDPGVARVVPSELALSQNRPNPFAGSTTIRLTLPTSDRYELSIYDLSGRLVRTYAETAGPGVVSITWDGKDEAGLPVGAGLYFYSVKSGNAKQTRKLLMLK
jgi:hypothetical protein